MSAPAPLPSDGLSPWHAGELALQRLAGVVARVDPIGREFVRTSMPEQHREFFPLLPFVLLGAVDPSGDVWATLRAGLPGFLGAPDAQHLSVDTPRDPLDPADAGMDDGHAIGLLGMDPMTRRRNRLNGTIRRTEGAQGFAIEVAQSFGACPRYIARRS